MNKAISIKLIFFAILCFYLFGYFFPEAFWGTHHFSFLNIYLQIAIAGIGFSVFFSKSTFTYINQLRLNRWEKLSLALVGAIIIYLLPIYDDIYGDSQFIRPQISVPINASLSEILTHLFTLNILDTKIGTSTFYGIISFFSKLTGQSGTDILPAMQGICYGLFIITWVNLADAITNKKNNAILYLVGILSPATLVFSAHFEIYFLPLLAITFYLFTLIKFFQTKQLYKWGALLIFAFLLSLKSHILALLLTPSLIMALVYYMDKQKKLNWSNMFRYGIMLTILGGILIYFFVTKSAFLAREYTSDTLEEHLFLPLKTSDQAPLNRYNMFSTNHIIDYFNMFFLWSGASLFFIVTSFFFRKHIHLKNPLNTTIIFTAILFLLTFFAINPLLSMPTDWDLFSIPSPIFMVLGLLIFTSIANNESENFIKKAGFALTILATSVVIANSEKASLQSHLEYTGKWNYKTYWIGSSTWFKESNKLIDIPEEQIKNLEELVLELKPFAVAGNDLQYAELLNLLGRKEIEVFNNHKKALTYFNEAYQYSKYHTKNIYSLVISNFIIGNYKQASSFLPFYSKTNHPSLKKALRISIHVSVLAENYLEAEQYCNRYLKNYPQDIFIQDVLTKLSEKENLHEVKQMFGAS